MVLHINKPLASNKGIKINRKLNTNEKGMDLWLTVGEIESIPIIFTSEACRHQKNMCN